MSANYSSLPTLAFHSVLWYQNSVRYTKKPVYLSEKLICLRFMSLVGKDSCLMVLQTDEHLHVYLDHMNTLGAAIEFKRHKKQMYSSRVGQECTFAVDEAKRLFAILSCHSVSQTTVCSIDTLIWSTVIGLRRDLHLYLRLGIKITQCTWWSDKYYQMVLVT